ncbi:MAG: DNA primase, partial [Planctomycetota bacterium]|nr:DNA primase [Planctomycetota bacterium]
MARNLLKDCKFKRFIYLDNDRVKMVKEASDIVDVVGSYISLRPAGQQTFKGLCPFHDDHRPSFDVDPKRGRYRCWSCGKYGDVITFVQEYEKVEFAEALEILAKRAGINLEKKENLVQNRLRGSMLDSVRWASDQYHQCLQESPLAAEARSYLSSRGLEDEIIRQFGLGFAPRRGDWLLELAHNDGMDVGMLEQVGLIGRKTDKPGLYDRFRDRIMFPIRNVLGNTVGFGGRIMPSSPFVDKAPKYYNSSDSPLFSKSEQLYGIDQARNSIGKVGYLAVVEGYTDVMMAHQMGVGNIVATMGTAINARHLRQLRRWTSKVVLVFDADAGGEQGVDRALELFVTNDMDLAIATLPEGLDPCDMLLNDGPEAFQEVLKSAVDAL